MIEKRYIQMKSLEEDSIVISDGVMDKKKDIIIRSDKDFCDLLNEQEKRIKELEYELNAFKPVMFQDMQKGTILLYTKDYGDD